MTALCEGKCGKTVTEAGKWCPECFFAEPVGLTVGDTVTFKGPFFAKPDPPRPAQALNSANLQSLRFEIAAAGFKVGFGREAERGPALDKLISLVHVLQQEQHLTKKET